MKIEINIDIEALVMGALKGAIREYIKENLVINNTPGESVTVAVKDKVSVTLQTAEYAQPSEIVPPSTVRAPVARDTPVWEYAPKVGKRRNLAEIALHEKELSLGRLLTPEEKGQTKGRIEVDDTTEEKAKQETIKKARIDQMAKEATEAAEVTPKEKEAVTATHPLSEMIDEKNKQEDLFPSDKPEEPSTPKTEDLENLSALFENTA